MPRVTGIGGIFFKSRDPKTLKSWYREHLGIEPDADGYVSFRWRENENPERKGYTVWEPFPQDTKYFDPSPAPFMVNYRVDDLRGLLARLREAGVEVSDKVEELEYGKFGWITDPEGNRLELWEPAGD
jgi:predicted enzyme related to lactoylglutathione lyase